MDSESPPRLFTVGQELSTFLASSGFLHKAWEEIRSACVNNVDTFVIKDYEGVIYVAFSSLYIEDFIVKDSKYGECQIQNENKVFSPCLKGNDDQPALVHKGALRRFLCILENSDFKDKMERFTKGRREQSIVFVGHSMGAAVATLAWTHNMRVASVVYVTDDSTGAPIDDPERLSMIKVQLCNVLKGDNDKRVAKTVVSLGVTHTERRLHQMMFADRDYERVHNDLLESRVDRFRPLVTVENCVEKGYSVINIKSKDRPKLLFDTVCTLTDMQYVVFHGTVDSDGSCALQEYYIRHMDGCPVNSEAERQRVIHCLEAAIERRVSEGLRLELCSGDQTGFLSDVTRIFRENGLSVTRAEVSTRGEKPVNVFYVTDASGSPVHAKTIEAVRSEIGQTILQVKESYSKSPSEETVGRFSFGNILRSTSERFLYNLGLTRSPS